MDNIINILPLTFGNRSIIAVLTRLLQDAEAGKIRSLAFCASMTDQSTLSTVVGDESLPVESATYALERLKFELLMQNVMQAEPDVSDAPQPD